MTIANAAQAILDGIPVMLSVVRSRVGFTIVQVSIGLPRYPDLTQIPCRDPNAAAFLLSELATLIVAGRPLAETRTTEPPADADAYTCCGSHGVKTGPAPLQSCGYYHCPGGAECVRFRRAVADAPDPRQLVIADLATFPGAMLRCNACGLPGPLGAFVCEGDSCAVFRDRPHDARCAGRYTTGGL